VTSFDRQDSDCELNDKYQKDQGRKNLGRMNYQ
jgi:hypothetical protein